MGDTLDRERINAFFDELEKDAAAEKVVFPGLRELAKRMSPGGFKRGWSMLSPTKLIQAGGKAGESTAHAVERTQAAQKALSSRATVPITRGGEATKGLFGGAKQYSGETLPGRARAYLATKLRAGTHLAPDAQLSSGVKGVAERLSRGGWTGEGAITKYLPIGQKGFITVGSAPQVYDIGRKAVQGRQPGESGIAEDVGNLAGFALPAIAFGGMPTASLVGSIGGMMAGGSLGRRLDKALSPGNRVQGINMERPASTAIRRTHGAEQPGYQRVQPMDEWGND